MSVADDIALLRKMLDAADKKYTEDLGRINETQRAEVARLETEVARLDAALLRTEAHLGRREVWCQEESEKLRTAQAALLEASSWKSAVGDEAAINLINPTTPRETLHKILLWQDKISTDPAVSEPVAALVRKANKAEQALRDIVGPGAQHEETCDQAEHDADSGCIWCEARKVLTEVPG